MIALKVEKIGDQVVMVLTEEALELLDAKVGGVLHFEPSRDAVLCAVTQEVWVEDTHARGRAFLKRYNRTFDRLTST